MLKLINTIPNLETCLDIDSNIQNAKEIILYHSTDIDLYEIIKQRGLEPRSVSGQDSNHSHNVEYQMDKVFLGTKELVRTPKISEAHARRNHKKTTTVVIIGVRVPTDQLFQDCDLFFSERYDDTQSQRISWYDGLRSNQSCSYKGIIPPDRIVSVEFKKRSVDYG